MRLICKNTVNPNMKLTRNETTHARWSLALTAIFCSAPLFAQNEPDAEGLPELAEMQAENAAPITEDFFLPETEGTKIYAGKKTSVALMEDMPEVVDQDIRQAFVTIPGVNVAEMAIPSITNINYRGLGDPHESGSILTMRNAVPLDSDWFGYPTIYYTPPIESVEKIEFIRGGGSLLYGPQPGPVINYVTYLPREDTPFGGRTQVIGGSYGLISNYTALSGTVDGLGYLADFGVDSANGARENSDYLVLTGDVTLTHQVGEKGFLRFDFTGYSSESGEAGTLTQAQYDSNRFLTDRPYNRIWIDKFIPVVTYSHAFHEDSLLEVKTWGGYQDRFSRRATGAGVTTTNLDRREFYSYGLDARMLRNWSGWGSEDSTLTAGFTFYYADAPRTRESGFSTGTTGTPVFKVENGTTYGAIFAENIFRFGDFAVIPSFRLDIPSIRAKEEYNTSVTRPLFDVTETSVVPLGGLGFTYDYNETNQAYLNLSTSYSPRDYGNLGNPTSNTARVSDNQVAYNYQVELGSRGNPEPYLAYDASIFFNRLTGIIESQTDIAGNSVQANAGDANFFGAEATGSIDVVALFDELNGTDNVDTYGSFNLFANTALLSAEFTSGQFDGNTPRYAPSMIWKWGAIWDFKETLRTSLTGQYVSQQYWQDSNSSNGTVPAQIPAYMVWDLDIEVDLTENVALLAGINNLFNSNYYSRIRSNGIEPLDGRTFWGGARVSF